MPKYWNAELEELRRNLKCAHCGATFEGSRSQAYHAKYDGRQTHCSATCRGASSAQKAREQAIREGKKPRKGVLVGPCPTCGKMFESRRDKVFCSLGCYTASDQFKAMARETGARTAADPETRKRIAEKLRTGTTAPCLECGEPVYSKKRQKRKFCSTVCYRAYMADRFDRWIANPEHVALPQCYDEFLDREELPCLVDGCEWEGLHLTLHMNQAHGVPADDFKRAGGFNLSTGVVARPLAEAYQKREPVGIATDPGQTPPASERSRVRGYFSLEAKEHRKKAMALVGPGPMRTCLGCGKEFQQRYASGRALYCSEPCRDACYAARARAKAKRWVRQEDGTFAWVSPQRKKDRRGNKKIRWEDGT